MSVRILLADDDELLRNLVKEVFEEEGFSVFVAADGEEALDIFWENPDISLAILDIMMPKMDGIQVLEEIRERTDVPVLMLTALGDSANELKCLRTGANDFVSKPFHYDILIERVKNILKLAKVETLETIRVGILELNSVTHKVYVSGEEVVLNNKEFQLLEFFVINRNIVLTREKILDRIWGYDYEGDIRTIDTHVKMLRSNLKEAGNYIKTIRGMGYSFEEKL